MKLMKKVTATMLGLTMALSFGACGGGKKDDSNDWNPSNPNTPNGPSAGLTGEGAKYMEGLVKAVREANTISVSTQFNMKFNTVDKTFGQQVYDEYLEDYVLDDYNDTQSTTANGNVTITIAKAGETYSLSMTGNVQASNTYYVDSTNQTTDNTDMPLDIRIVGDYAYMQQEGQWFKSPIDWEDVEMSLGLYDTPAVAILSEAYTMLMEGDLTEVYNLLGPIFEHTLMLDIQNQKYNFELDAAEAITSAIEYITTLDYNQTILAYLNSILVEAGAETTLEEILRDVATKGTMTVQELYNALNEALVEETGKNINGIKSELLAQIDINEFKGYVDEETFAQISQMYTMLSELNIETELAPYMSLTINDLVTMLMADEESEEPVEITLGMLVEQVISMMDSMTLKDMLGEDYFEGLNEIKTLTLNELKQSVSIQFNGYKISSANYSQGVDFSFNGSEMSLVMDTDATVSISLSNQTTTIEAPEGAIDMPTDEGAIPTGVCINCGNPNIVYEYEGFGFCAECYEICFGA